MGAMKSLSLKRQASNECEHCGAYIYDPNCKERCEKSKERDK